MRITIKTLSQQIYHIDAEEDETVLELKNKLQTASNNSLPASQMKLIYSGSILEDDKTLKQYNIDEKKFVVVMVRPNDAKVVVSDSSASNIGQANSMPQRTADNQQDSRQPAAYQGEQQTNTTLDNRSHICATESLTNPGEIETAIKNMMDALGYSRATVEQAFHRSFNNPTRAVEYLLHPMSDAAEADTGQQASNPGESQTHNRGSIRVMNEPNQQRGQAQQVQQSPGNQPNTSHDLQASPLAFLRAHPRFHHLRAMLQRNPQLIESVIAEIAATNAVYLDVIRENQDEFIQLINEPIDLDSPNNTTEEAGQSIEVHISPEDWLAISRLRELGFDEAECIEAYIACERNEQLAANYLLNNFEFEQN